MPWAPLTGVLMASNWNSPIPVLGSPSTTALYPSPFIQQRPVCWCRAHPTFLWVDEHLPTICKQAELRYMQTASTWTASARRHGIGLKRERRPTRHSRSMRSSRLDDLSSPNDLLAHTSELEDPPLLEIPGTSTATRSPPGVERSSSPAAVGIGPPAGTVHMSCEAEDTSSIGDPLPTTEGTVTAMHSDQATAVEAPMISKKTKCPKKKTATKKKKKTVKFDLSERHCYSKCKVSTSTDMIRCSLCMVWFHVEYTGKDTHYQGVWCCHSCRTLPKSIQGMTEQIELLISSLESIRNSEAALQAEVKLLKAENGNLPSKLSRVELHNSELGKLIETMSFPVSSGTHDRNQRDNIPTPNPSPPSQRPEPEQPWVSIPTANRFQILSNPGAKPPSPARTQPLKQTTDMRSCLSRTVTSSAGPSQHENITVTVIGSSIVHGVAPLVHGKGFDACGCVFPGCTARAINARIRNIPVTDVTVLAAGANNIETQTVEECSKEIYQTIDNVARKRRQKPVVMFLLPHRYDKPKLNHTIDAVNDFIAQEVNKRPYWYLLKHNVSRDDFKSDGLHFNSRGTAKYAHEIRHIIRSIKLE